MIKLIRGFLFKLEVPNEFCILVLKNKDLKIQISNITRLDNKYYLVSQASATSEFDAGLYKYQILDNYGIVEAGDAEILQNYLLAGDEEEVKSRNEILLQAIEAQLAGIATSAQASISVGDKSISYLSISELLKLRQYYKARVDEEKGKRNPNNEGKILYRWRGI